MQKFRGFIGIDIDDFPKIIEFEKEIKKTNSKIKLVELKNIHITLKFLGDTSEDQIRNIENIMKNAIQDIEPFNITLKGVGVFPNKRYIKIIILSTSVFYQITINSIYLFFYINKQI